MSGNAARRKSTAEWVSLSLSVLVVGALIVVALVEESLRQHGDVEGLQVTFDREHAPKRGESFYVPYTVLNTGSEAISAAEIWIEVSDGERVVESAEITVQFLPLRGKQDGVFVTTRDPKIYPRQSRVESLQFP
jgi:uncharacterized protein (TIGR02588 family)